MICYCNGAEATDVLDREIKRKGGASVKCHIEMFGGGGAVKKSLGEHVVQHFCSMWFI